MAAAMIGTFATEAIGGLTATEAAAFVCVAP